MNNSQLRNDPIKTDDERNNFNFSAHRKHRNPPEISEIQGGKSRDKTPVNQRSFQQPIPYHVIDSLQIKSCMSITCDVLPLVRLFIVRCVVCLQFTPTVFSYDWIDFLKSASSFDFEQWKKRSQRMKRNRHRRQVYLSFLTMFPARVPGHLKIDVQCTIRAGQYKCTNVISLLVII